jgi:nitrate/nitrite-specific signal transduction histidine kinase
LLGMRERIQALRGHCEIRGLPGQGTTVRVNVPVDAVLATEEQKHERVDRG